MLVARDVWLFALGRALMSLALGNSGLMMTTLAERVPQHRVGLAFAIMNSAAPLGYFAGPLAGGPVVDAWGLPVLIAVNMGLILLVTLAVAFGYDDPYQGKATGSLWQMAVGSLALIGRSPRVRAVFIGIFALFLGWQVALPYIPIAVTEVYRGADPGFAIGLVAGVGGLATMVFGPVTGALADRFGRWRVLLIGAALGMLLLPLPLVARSLPGLIVTWGAANGVLSSLFAVSFTVLSDSTSEDTRGRVMSFAYLPMNVSAVVGAALASRIALYGVWWVFPAASLLTVLGIGVMALAAQQARAIPAEAATW